MNKENCKNDEFKWSLKFKLFLSTFAAIIIFGSYFMSVMADNANGAGNIEESEALGLMGIISLPAALLATAMVAWKLVFNVPTEKDPSWMQAKSVTKK